MSIRRRFTVTALAAAALLAAGAAQAQDKVRIGFVTDMSSQRVPGDSSPPLPVTTPDCFLGSSFR